ncbi:hypothetical protein [Paraburkholderia sp. SIMBA_027]|uniref:hypothetical protein n=1 Tax=Paraburkholderia sp. SIMBA_027 TaxID=3085770 RepID=UPI00397901DE
MTVSTSPTIHIDATEGKAYGACAAALLQHIRFWVKQNAEHGRNLRDGRYWTYDSCAALAEKLVMFSPHQVRRGIEKLLTLGVIVKRNYGHKWDRTSWYTLANVDEASAAIEGAKKKSAEKPAPEQLCAAIEAERADLDEDDFQERLYAFDITVPQGEAVTLPALPDGCVWMREDKRRNYQDFDEYHACTMETAVEYTCWRTNLDPDVARAWFEIPQFRTTYFDLETWKDFALYTRYDLTDAVREAIKYGVTVLEASPEECESSI